MDSREKEIAKIAIRQKLENGVRLYYLPFGSGNCLSCKLATKEGSKNCENTDYSAGYCTWYHPVSFKSYCVILVDNPK
jgi:hypothetical protein